jgi:predicted ATPase/DNA-binding SARP family transcriptional activator
MTLGSPAGARTHPRLEIQLFSDFRLAYGDTLVNITSARLQSLLAYLLLHRDTIQYRQHLAFLFWPDSTETQARTNLRYLLHQLRATLPNMDCFIDVQTQTLRWRPDTSFTLDVAEFERAAQRVTQVEQSGNQLVLQILEQAVGLYQGDLIPACYDDWITPKRERLCSQFLRLLAQLIALLEDQRDYCSAISYAQRLLLHNPLHEETYLRLLRLHALAGDRARGLRVYHTCVTTLQKELGVEPMPAIRKAYERLLKMEMAPESGQPVSATLTTPPPLVGRQPEWTQLLTIWSNTSQGVPHFVLIAGEAGVGKSRLAEELLTWTAQQGFTTASSRCYAAEGSLAYAPIRDWLRGQGIRTTLHKLDVIWLTEVARLLPELLTEQPDLPRPERMTAGWQRQRLFEALARAVLTTNQPLLLVLDDLQWCDRDTLEWMRYLLRADLHAKLLIVCSVRSEEMQANRFLITLLWQLRQDRQFTEINLAPLSPGDTGRLATHITGCEVDADQAAHLYKETEGNPLFLVEIVRADLGRRVRERAEAGGPTVSAAQYAHPSGALPPRIQNVVESRLAQLSSPARELAGLAAVIGRKFTLDVLAETSDSDEGTLVRALDELQERHIIREQSAATYDFSHDKIREVTYAQLSTARRRLLHRRVALALEKVYAADLDSVGGQVGMHYERASLAPQAVLAYQRAAAVAQRIYANQQAIEILDRALGLQELIETQTRSGRTEQVERELALQEARGVSLIALKGYGAPQVRETYTRVRALYQQLDRPLSPPVLQASARISLTRPELQEAYELGGQLLARAQHQRDPVARVEAHYLLGVTLFWQGKFLLARKQLKRALAGYDQQQARVHIALYGQDPKAICLIRLAQVQWYLGYPDQAVQTSRRAVEYAEALSHPFSMAYALAFEAWLANDCRDVQIAQKQAKKAMTLASWQGLDWFQMLGTLLYGYALVQQADIEHGIARINEGMRAFHSTGQDLYRPYALASLAQAHAKMGQIEPALNALTEALAFTDRTGDRFWEAELHRLRGEFLLAQDNTVQAEKSLRQALHIARRQQAKSLELRTAMSLTRLWLRQGQRQHAQAELAQIYSQFSEGLDMPDLKEAKSLLQKFC